MTTIARTAARAAPHPFGPRLRLATAPTLTLALTLTLNLASAQAQTPTSTIPNGRLLASNCFQCHGTNGNGPGFDRLAGKSAPDIYGDLKEFQSGKEGNGIMAKHALGYTDAQLQALSQWLSTQR